MSELTTGSITNLYKGVGSLDKGKAEDTGTSALSFADVLLKDPTKNLVQLSHKTEDAAQLAALGQVDEQTLSEIVTEMDIALQSFKSIWEKSLQALNELPRISM
ncbi:MAG: hypothetical protein LCH26_06565 [Proteobacteria bacterium]|nr:hypothetical protein [Pseudomonadota bacterium]